MREKIDSFAKGIFPYENSGIIISISDIDIVVEMGRQFHGSFVVESDSDAPVRGLVYSDNPYLSFEQASFCEKENEIKYIFDAACLDAGEVVKGRIAVVTGFGERVLHFYAKIGVPACDTSIGKISDMFHFANLAMSSWLEAKNIFKSDEFKRVLRYYDKKFDVLYTHLQNCGNVSQALEEFLVAARKKKPICFAVDKPVFTYDVQQYSFMDKLTITKDTWGYAQLQVESTADFIVPERKLIWSEDFVLNNFELGFVIKPELMRYGMSFGCIRISSPYQELTVEFVCSKKHADTKGTQNRLKEKKYQVKLLSNYLNWRIGRLTNSKYVNEATSILSILTAFRPMDIYLQLYQVELKLVMGKDNAARVALDVLKDDDWREGDSLVYGAVLYFEARMSKDNHIISELANAMRELYMRDGSFFSFWFTLDYDRRLKVNRSARFDAMKEQYTNGARSPILYLEAVNTANDDPLAMKELGSFELQLLNFGFRQSMVSRNVVLRAAYLAKEQGSNSPLLCRLLKRAYEAYKQSEVLEALCLYYIANDIRSTEAYRWLAAGVNNQLRVNGLHEQCLYAAGEEPEAVLPKQLFTYFSARMLLDESVKQRLYANIIRYKEKSDPIYMTFIPQIEEYAIKQLHMGSINRSLAVIYDRILTGEVLNNEIIELLPDVIFKYELITENKNAVSVCVVHKELDNEVITEITHKTADIELFTEDTEILICDDRGSRCKNTIPYTITRYINRPDLLELCMQQCNDDKRVLLYHIENGRYSLKSDELMSLIRYATALPGLNQDFKVECEKELIYYYYENLEGELLENHLLELDLLHLSHAERVKMIELMILRELYNLSLKNMELYGFYDVDSKRLLKLCARLIPGVDAFTCSDFFKKLCYYVFSRGKYDETLLLFLDKTYNGETDAMYEVWRTSINFGIDTTNLEERLLAQLLFTQNDMNYAREVFMHYYSHGCTRKLIRAFLSYYAYEYMVHDCVLEQEMFHIMRREANYEENDVCMLALLKHYCHEEKLTDADLNFIEYQLHCLEKKDIILPFFREYAGRVRIPEAMSDKYYVEYHTDPQRRVRIHYCLDDGQGNEGYTVEDMKNVCYGIFVKEFILFYGESLQYYISEENSNECSITESKNIQLEPELIGSDDTKYHQLNLIITAREMNDDKTVMKMLEGYIRNDYESTALFKAL